MSQKPIPYLEPHERRNAPRYPVRAHAELQFSDENWDVHLLDISATGARLAILDEHQLKPDNELNLTIEMEELLPNNLLSSPLHLHGKVVHVREHIIGLELIFDNQTEIETLKTLLNHFENINLE